MSTLLVCTANVCRSPSAEGLWRAAAVRRGVIRPVASAGLQALPGQPAHPVCVELLAERGIDLGEHRSQRFRPDLGVRYDLILTMEQIQMRYIETVAPVLAGRVQLLGRWGQGPIADPIGGDRPAFQRCVELIETAIDSWLDRLSGLRQAGASA